MEELRYVACKIHQLNPLWKPAKKHSYTRHALREYEIHKQLRHEHIVQLFDVFEIDDNSFQYYNNITILLEYDDIVI